jgi:hypothetical protein
MKFRYIGDYVAGQNTCVAFGHTFSPGAVVDVTDAQAIKKLSNNRFFERAADPAPVQQPGTDADAAAKKARAELIAKAESLGVEFDKRWSAAKIQDAIDAHQAS